MENDIAPVYYVPAFSDQFPALFSTILKWRHFYWKKYSGRAKSTGIGQSPTFWVHILVQPQAKRATEPLHLDCLIFKMGIIIAHASKDWCAN